MSDRTKEYIGFTKNCGDCGRRFKMKFEIPDVELNRLGNPIITKKIKDFVGFMFPKNDVCCKHCSEKKTMEYYGKSNL